MSRTPQLGEVIEEGALTVLAERNQTMPGRVVSYDRTTQRAQVEPALRIARGDVDGDGVIDYDPLPVLLNVPVQWPRAGGYAMHMDLREGDWVLLVVCARSLDEWMDAGTTGVEPADLRVGALQDAVAIPGVYPNGDGLGASVARAAELVISDEAGAVQVRLRAGEVVVTAPVVRLGGPGANTPIALASATDGLLSAIVTELNKVIVAVNALAPGTAVPIPIPIASVAATKVRAE